MVVAAKLPDALELSVPETGAAFTAHGATPVMVTGGGLDAENCWYCTVEQ